MTLTHEQIAGMTCEEVNVAIAKRLIYPDFDGYPKYTSDWTHAGRLLEMMTENCVAVQLIFIEAWGNWTARREKTETIDHDISYACATALEAIARCFLEWYDATHEARP